MFRSWKHIAKVCIDEACRTPVYVDEGSVGLQELLDQGNTFGWTPLFYAVMSNQYLAAKKLIDLGSRINMSSAHESNHYELCNRIVPANATPLWAALNNICEAQNMAETSSRTPPRAPLVIIHDTALAKLLLTYGAEVDPLTLRRCYGGRGVLNKIREEMEKERALVATAIENSSSSTIPSELIEMMINYVGVLSTPAVAI